MSHELIRLARDTRRQALEALSRAPDGHIMEIREPRRTDDQNAAVHGLIGQILKQRPHLNGLKMTKESYKAIFMHALGHEMQMLPTLAGDGFFPLGLSTSKLTVAQFTDLIEFILAWCAEQDISVQHFDDPHPTRGVSQSEAA